MQEIARQLTHPIPRLWTLSLQNSLIGMGGSGFDGVEPAYAGTFQPTLPLDLSRLGLQDRAWARGFSLRTQLTIPILETLPESRSGFGDIQLVSGLAPTKQDTRPTQPYRTSANIRSEVSARKSANRRRRVRRGAAWARRTPRGAANHVAGTINAKPSAFT